MRDRSVELTYNTPYDRGNAMTGMWEPRYARRAERMRASEIRELLKLLDKPGIISFAGGIPDPALFPVDAVKAAYVGALSDPTLAASGLQYSASEGYLPLRNWIVEHMAKLGVACDARQYRRHVGVAAGARVPGTPAPHARTIRRWLRGSDLSRRTASVLGAHEPNYDTLRPRTETARPRPIARPPAPSGGVVEIHLRDTRFANPTGETMSLAGRQRIIDLARGPGRADHRGYGLLALLRFEGAAGALHSGHRREGVRRHQPFTRHLLRHVLQDADAGVSGSDGLRRPQPIVRQV